MAESIKLPAPRLQLRWISGGERGYDWTCVYELVLPLHKFDIRRERASGLMCDELALEISRTSRASSSVPNDAPYRDGAHARWDAQALGGHLPIIVLDPEGRPFVETLISEPEVLDEQILGPARRMVPYDPSAHEGSAAVKPPTDWPVSDSTTARAILNYLGIREGLDPGADRRRDKVAAIICAARERDAAAIGREDFRDAAKKLAGEVGFLSIEDLDAILPASKGGEHHG